MTALRHEPGDLLLQLQDDHPPGITPHQCKELSGQLVSDRLLPVGAAHIVAQIVMNIKYLRCWGGIGHICHGWAVLPTLHAPGRANVHLDVLTHTYSRLPWPTVSVATAEEG